MNGMVSVSTGKGGEQRPNAGVALLLVLLLGLLMAAAGEAKKKRRSNDDLFNPLLGVEYSHWLVGPIAEMASNREIEDYLGLVSDEQAQEFIEKFWAERNAETPPLQRTPEQIFARRSAEADKLYTEGAFPGSRTDRGTVYILYGEPEKVEFESPTRVDQPVLEVFVYPAGAAKGLDGKSPKRQYRFYRDGEQMRFYTGKKVRRDPRDRLRPGRGL